MVNLSNEPYTIQVGERVAQMVISTYSKANLVLFDELEKTERGEGGFNSTGKF